MKSEYKITGTLTFEEYLECHTVLASKRRRFFRALIIIYGAGMVAYGLLQASPKLDGVITIFGAIFILYGVVLSPIQFRYRVKRNWDRYPKIKEEFDFLISEAGLESKDDKGNPYHSNWDGFSRFGESRSLFMLYLSPLLPMCLPKRLIPKDELSAVRDLISSSIENVDGYKRPPKM